MRPRLKQMDVHTASPRLPFSVSERGLRTPASRISSEAFVRMSNRVFGELENSAVNQKELCKNMISIVFDHAAFGQLSLEFESNTSQTGRENLGIGQIFLCWM